MAVNASLLGIPVDTGRLFDGDGEYGLWIEAVIDEANDAHERITEAVDDG
jgi:hypothetical protein